MLLNTIKENLRFTLPILTSRLLGILSNLIAMMLIARLGVDALSASALIMGIFSLCVLLVMCFGFSVCALVAEADSKNDLFQVGQILTSALTLSTVLACPFIFFFLFIADILIFLHQPPHVAELVGLYFKALLLGYIPMIWASIFEQYFVGMGRAKIMVWVSLLNIVLMPALSYALIFGQLGLPKLEMFGAGLAASITALFILTFLGTLFVLQHAAIANKINFIKINFICIKKISSLGWPIAIQFAGEFLAYTLLTIMMGWIGTIALAAQQIILQFTTIVVMIPTSVAQATAVLVGKSYGHNSNTILIRHQVYGALLLVNILLLIVGLLYWLIPSHLISIYIENESKHYHAIVSMAVTLLGITAVSQFFDGIKNVLSGALRGLQDTNQPMLICLGTLWLIGMPLAYTLGFKFNLGAIGLRIGFAFGVVSGAVLLLFYWKKKLTSIPIRERERELKQAA